MNREMVSDGLIIGGGISGLALAHWLGLHHNPGSWELWEAQDHVGGTIGTDRAEGYSVDWGPNGFLDREPLTLRLVEEIGLDSRLEPARSESNKRFIAKNGRLHPVPLSPAAMLVTPLLSLPEKLRVFMEPFIPARRNEEDESVFDFASRRIGRGAAETFVDPMVSGVYGGVASELSLPACFPAMREMEIRYGGLVKALMAKRRERKRTSPDRAVKARSGGPAGPGGRLTSFEGGLDLLVKQLQKRLRPIIRTNHPAIQIRRLADCWEVLGDKDQKRLCKHLVLACPTFAAAQLARHFDPELAEVFNTIPYAPIVVVATGHHRREVEHPLDGFGFIIPRNQKLRTLGSIWTSSIFEGRAPVGCAQFRTMLGGAGDPEIMKLSDEQLWESIRTELGPILGLRGEPAFVRIYRWEKGIPQYTLGHCARRTRLQQLVSQNPELHVIGNAYCGVGLNDCVKMAYHLAQKLLAGGSRDSQTVGNVVSARDHEGVQ